MAASHRNLGIAVSLALIVLWAGAAVCASAEQPSPNQNSALGINLGGVTYWSTEIVFVDIFRHSQTFKSQAPGKSYGRGGALDVDENGWVRSLADGVQFFLRPLVDQAHALEEDLDQVVACLDFGPVKETDEQCVTTRRGEVEDVRGFQRPGFSGEQFYSRWRYP